MEQEWSRSLKNVTPLISDVALECNNNSGVSLSTKATKTHFTSGFF